MVSRPPVHPNLLLKCRFPGTFHTYVPNPLRVSCLCTVSIENHCWFLSGAEGSLPLLLLQPSPTNWLGRTLIRPDHGIILLNRARRFKSLTFFHLYLHLACSHWIVFPLELFFGSALGLSIVHSGRGKMNLVPWCLETCRPFASQVGNRGKETWLSHSRTLWSIPKWFLAAHMWYR